MSEALVNSQTPQQWCYRALTAEARMMELEAKLEKMVANAESNQIVIREGEENEN